MEQLHLFELTYFFDKFRYLPKKTEASKKKSGIAES